MFLNTNENDFNIPNRDSSEYIFEDNLLDLAKKFKFSEFTYSTLIDTCNNEKFKESLFNYCSERLNLDLDEIKYYFNENTPLESDYLNNMIDKQYKRIQMLCIEFAYCYLPFNYIIKLNKMKKLNASTDFMEENYSIGDLRKDLIFLLNNEIQKISNVDKTIETIKNSLGNKKQLEKIQAIQSASLSVSKKTIIENKFLISIIDTIPSEKLISLITDILDDKMIQDNLV